MNRKLIFEKSIKGRKGYALPECDVPAQAIEDIIPKEYIRIEEPELPEVGEVDTVRHFTLLSGLNYGVDNGLYPLGSCTMKYNPKINEDVSRLDGFTGVHPDLPDSAVQGCLELLYKMDLFLSEITGMERISLQPAAGAHGELAGLMMMKAFHQYHGEGHRNKIIVPDSAHGTNPASAAMVGYEVIEVKTDSRGNVDLSELKKMMSGGIAGIMLTNPSTLGLFEENICEITDIIHKAGGLVYYDGANLNAIMGITRPGDMGFDIVHLNLHKTFSTPHGGGGPGSGPVGVKKDLVPFLPVPLIQYKDGQYIRDYDRPLSIGRVRSYFGNFSVIVKAYAYILTMGAEGLRHASETAVLNANYLMHKLKKNYELPYDRTCMHEFVLSGRHQKDIGITVLDIAKRMMDYGIHPPTVYFPLKVKEAMMFEPTETESLETIDEAAEILMRIAAEAEENPELLKEAPHRTPVARLDEVRAVREPVLKWHAKNKEK